jgi:putative RNA 2'-phosphotransferase
MDEIQLSKFLSLVLRHKPETINLTLDPSGWVSVNELLEALAAHGKPVSLQQLQAVVAGSDKQRFALSADKKLIRASQGHSLEVDPGYEPVKPPATLYHGTATRFLDSIKEHGLQKQERQHVHLSTSIDTASKVGSRYGKPVILTIEALRMHLDGYSFYVSANGVWLTDRVPVAYIIFPEGQKGS